MSGPIFFVGYDVSYMLRVEDIWSDGDAPENPTAEDVAEVMRGYGDMHRTLHDWNLGPEEVYVSGPGPVDPRGHVRVWPTPLSSEPDPPKGTNQ